jgi:hypothetical protein
MIIEYDVVCFERTLTIKFPDDHESLKEDIIKMLDVFYDEWMNTGEITNPEIQDLVDSTCLEEYMTLRLSETYGKLEEWESIPYGEDYEPRETMWVCDHCLAAITSREGNQATLTHYIDSDDLAGSMCDWCEQVGFDTLYELI